MTEETCCPRFDPESWDRRTVEWKDKTFVKESVRTALHVPLNFSQVISRLMKKVEEAHAKSPEYLCLSDHTSKWNMDLYLAVDKEIPGAENVRLSGKFISKVYEGPFKDTGRWCQDFERYAKDQGTDVKKWYMWYTTCPKCAKKYGKNYVVILGEVSP